MTAAVKHEEGDDDHQGDEQHAADENDDDDVDLNDFLLLGDEA